MRYICLSYSWFIYTLIVFLLLRLGCQLVYARWMNFQLCHCCLQSVRALFEWRDQKLSGAVESTQLLGDLLAQLGVKVLFHEYVF